MFGNFFGSFIGDMCLNNRLKAPGNYLDQIWSSKISVLLLEGPKRPNSMIYGLWDPLEPRIYGSEYTNLLQTYEKIWKRFWKYYFYESGDLNC